MDDRYKVDELIEELSFGTLYIAEDSFIQRKVQLFRYKAPSSDSDDWKEIFNEASGDLATASHPGIPIIYTHAIDDESPYTIRQLVNSTPLNTRLADGGPLGEYEAWELAYQMLEIHDAAKPSGNFHGALDANYIGLIARPSGQKLYSITDYGLAEIYKRINKNSDYLGAPYLISPEQAKGEDCSELSQIYSIGQLVFHGLSGGHPWIETPQDDIIKAQVDTPLTLVTDYNASVPEAFALWIDKMMALDPADRYQTYEEALSALPQPIQSAPVPVQATAAVYTVPATATQPDEAATDRHTAQQIIQAEKTSPLKNPVILGAVAVVLAALVFFLTRPSDDDSLDPFSNSTETASLPRDGLIAYLSFEKSSLAAVNNPEIKLEALSDAPVFSREGKNGTALRIDKSHYYRLALPSETLNNSAGLTFSFWLRPRQLRNQDISVKSDQPWESDDASSNKLLWSPENAIIAGRSWNLVTVVYDTPNERVIIYLDGQKVESAGNSAIKELSSNPFIYIGCDSKGKALHKSSLTVDNMALWDRVLSAQEIQQLFDN